MVFGHNLQHMAPFGIPTTGFGTVFRHAHLLFSGSGVIFGPRDAEFGPPDVPAGLGTFLGQKWGPEKDGFAQEMVPQGVSRGSVQGEWIVWYPGGLWAGQFPPKPYQKKIIRHTGPPGPGPLGPWGPWWPYTTPDQPALVGLYVILMATARLFDAAPEFWFSSEATD